MKPVDLVSRTFTYLFSPFSELSVLFRTNYPQQEAHRCVQVSQSPHCCTTFPMCPPKCLCPVATGWSPPGNATVLGGEIFLEGVESRSHWGHLKLPVQGLLELQNCLPLGVNPNQQPGTHSSGAGSIGPWDLQVKLWVRCIYLSPPKAHLRNEHFSWIFNPWRMWGLSMALCFLERHCIHRCLSLLPFSVLFTFLALQSLALIYITFPNLWRHSCCVVVVSIWYMEQK